MSLTFKYRPPHKKTVLYEYKHPKDLVTQYDDIWNNIMHEEFPPLANTDVNLKNIHIDGKDMTEEIQDFTFDHIGSYEVFIEDLVDYLRAKYK